MKRISLCIVLATILYLDVQGQKFSDTGLKLYWKFMDRIAIQDSISISDLDSLWYAPGYSSWTDTERSQKIHFNYFTLVNAPYLRDSLKNEMARSSEFRLKLFNHFIEAKNKREELNTYAEELMSSDILEKAKQEAFKYLPDTLSVENDTTLISLMIFKPDAFAFWENNIIIMDILFAHNYGKGFEKFLGHELYHIYSKAYYSKLKPVDYNKDALVWSIDKLCQEGIADMIDKEFIMDKKDKSDYDKQYYNHYANGKSHIQKIDSLLQIMARDASRQEELGKEVRRALPYAAHPTGLYVAKAIKKYLGHQTLLQCLESPFDFLYLYNEAARLSENQYHILSEESIRYLKTIELEYVD